MIKQAIRAMGWKGGTTLADQLKEAEMVIAGKDAWIKKTLPWLEAYAETMRDSTQEWDKNSVAQIDAIIAEATE
jgi:hypothetical protein